MKMKIDELLNNLTIVFPMYNEEKRVKNTIRRLNAFYEEIHYFPEIIFVLDGCTDNTKSILESSLKESIIYEHSKIIEYKNNRGIGYAMNKGLDNVRTRYVLFSDFDLSTPLTELNQFSKYLPEFDIVIGSRWTDRSRIQDNQFRKMMSLLSISIIKSLLKLKLSDTQCGFKLYKTDIARKVYEKRTIDRFGVDFELMFIATKSGFKIKEIPVEWKHEEESTVHLRDYLITLKELIKVRKNDRRGKYS
ncbi:MAG: dolichyl-phosphate beta-glucosyltransferase [Candidatus Woesearchaeota archaeon]|nr:dolichyl-phosphate beta-glucosyltransferase [Candidatus Woesearchaeota archaeon]